MDVKKIVGKNLRKERKRIAWTQEKLAIRSGVNPQYLSRLELGQENVKIETLQKIAKVLKVDAYKLLQPPE